MVRKAMIRPPWPPWRLAVTKDFKIVYFFEEGEYYLVDYCTLNIYLDLEKMELIYDWNYEFDNNAVYITKI